MDDSFDNLNIREFIPPMETSLDSSAMYRDADASFLKMDDTTFSVQETAHRLPTNEEIVRTTHEFRPRI